MEGIGVWLFAGLAFAGWMAVLALIVKAIYNLIDKKMSIKHGVPYKANRAMDVNSHDVHHEVGKSVRLVGDVANIANSVSMTARNFQDLDTEADIEYRNDRRKHDRMMWDIEERKGMAEHDFANDVRAWKIEDRKKGTYRGYETYDHHYGSSSNGKYKNKKK